MKKYGVYHRITMAYHPNTSGQVEVTNQELKSILEKTVQHNKRDWSDWLDDVLWSYRIAYKTSTGHTPHRFVYGKACHLTVELEHQAYWAIKSLNFDIGDAQRKRKFQLNELKEHRQKCL